MGLLIRYRLGIKAKLILISGILVVVPLLGYRYVLEMESYLRSGQEQVLLGTAQALATALSERPELFSENSYSRGQGRDKDLYVYPVYYPLATDDGNLLDWQDYQLYEREFNELPNLETGMSREDFLSYNLMLAEHNNYLYLYLKVEDETIVLRDPGGLSVDRSDSLRLSMLTSDGIFERYVVAPHEDEFIYTYRIGTVVTDISSLEHEPRITGRWNQRDWGYEAEMRLPLELLGDKLGIGIIDVDDEQFRGISAFVSTSGMTEAESLGTLQRPTPEIDRIIEGMGNTNSRIQVVDADQRMLLSVGNIQTATGTMLQPEEISSSGVWGWIENKLLHPLYYQVLSKPTTDFVDDLYQGGTVEGEHISSALQGKPLVRFREVNAYNEVTSTRILEAAYPILGNGEVLGAVLVDQNMNGIRTFRNQALESLFDTMLAIFLLIITVLFFFASNLAARIRSLRNQAEKILDDSGRLTNTITASRNSDEIGDLSRSFSNIVERLGQHTNYLENMASRLSHELRTPVTVVRSSLENLRMSSDDSNSSVYLQRAEEGIKRLNMILTNMSEASRLEHILRDSDKELADVGKLVAACMAGYKQVYPNQLFEIQVDDAPLLVMGGADYLAQCLDKLIANAVDFSFPDRPIIAKCFRDANEIVMSVTNFGPYLNETMEGNIFDSMVSVRPQSKQQEPHLGMGLHIVRMIAEYHGGYAMADNLLHDEGVVVSIRLPAKEIKNSE